MSIKKLSEKRASLYAEQRDILKQAEERGEEVLKGEHAERFDKLEADYDDLGKQIERLQKQEDREKEMAKKEDRVVKDPKKVKEEAFMRYLATGRASRDLEFQSIADGEAILLRDTQDGQNVGTPADGGYTVPELWAGQIETARKDFGGIYTIANVMPTPNGRKLYMPTVNDTGNKSTILSEETINTADTVTFGTKEIDAYVLATPIVPMSLQLLQDSNYDIMSYIINLMAERDARGINYYATVGSGDSQPQGVVGASTKGEDAAATAITRDNIVDLVHSVDVAYRQNAHFMLNDSTLQLIKKLTVGTSDDRPLWQPGMAFGDPATIEGYKYVINSDMADVEASAKSVVFGDFSKFLIRTVKGFQVVRFEEKYMNSLQKAIMGWSRMDSELLDAGTNPIKHILHAAS